MSDVELASLFAKVPTNSIVRTWFFQQQAINTVTHGRDWRALDRVTRLAAAHHVKLIASLAGGGGCDDGLPGHDIRWYLNTIPNRLEDNTADAGHGRNGGWGADLTSYDQWVTDVVSRYRNDATIAMWEPFSEAEADQPDGSCNQAAGNSALVKFFSQIGDLIHALDGNHLVGSGLMGNGACGTNGVINYHNLTSLAGLDVMSVHLYQPIGAPPVPGYMASDIAATTKPTIIGELGIQTTTNESIPCPNSEDPEQRASDFAQQTSAQLTAGIAAILAWNYGRGSYRSCTLDIHLGDPMFKSFVGAGV